MQTIQFKVDNNYVDIALSILKNLNSLKLNVIHDLFIADSSLHKNINQELKSFSNHTVNLIEEWKDHDEDDVWK